MGSVTVPALIAYAGAAASVVGTGVSMYESHESGVAQANQDKQKALVAQQQATQQQINMRQNMLRALSSQNAQAGVGGIGTGGGFGANVTRQIDQNQSDLLVSRANGSAQVSLLDQAASNAQATGNFQALSTGLNKVGTALSAVGSS